MEYETILCEVSDNGLTTIFDGARRDSSRHWLKALDVVPGSWARDEARTFTQ